MARHQVFVLTSNITPGQEETLDRRLHALPRDAFKTFPMVHFASFVILRTNRTERPPMLVMECNIDGLEKTFFQRLADGKALDVDAIFECCEKYTKGDHDAKVRFFEESRKRPQLYHVGAPWRSVASIREDHEIRRTLEHNLHASTHDSLMTDIVVPPAGQQEYWFWEMFKPWAAWLLLFGGPALAIGLSVMTRNSPRHLPRWAVLLLTAFYVSLALKSILGALALWYESLPELRARVRPWIGWILVTGAWAAVAKYLWAAHQRWAVGLLVAWALVLVANFLAAVRRRSNERLAAIRVNTNGPSIADIWAELTKNPVQYLSETEWAQRLLYWTAWLIAFLVVALPIRLLVHRLWWLIAFVGTLFFLKAVWLAVLAGWPSKGGKGDTARDTARIVLFIVLATVIAAAATGLLMVIDWPPCFGPKAKTILLTALSLIGMFSLWAMPLPSPDPPPLPRRPDREEVINQEDHGMQNHMSAVVVLKQDHAYRVPALRFFLFVLNRLFYRCWAPDLYRGKLFGIPTVHFAQWVLLDKRNYLFLSNYDNSWTTYLDDFGETLAAGLQKVWGQGIDNPGIKDLGRFKEFARSTMVPYAYWYSAYPEVTIRQVWNNREIRRGLAYATGEEAMVTTLRRVGAAPRTIPDFYHGRVR